MTRRLLVTLLCAAAPALASAEVRKLTLGEVVEDALAASASLSQSRALERAAEADLRGARAGRLPQAEVSAGYARNSDVPELSIALPGAPPRTLFPNIPDNYRTRLGVSLPLFTGGRIGGLIDAAGGEREAAGQDVRSARADLVLEATGAYWSLVTAQDSERVLLEAVSAYEAHLKDARNREAVGMAARNEVLAVQVERDRAELARLRARNAAEVAQANLARLLGVAPDIVLEPAEPLERPAMIAAETEALVAQALASRPERAGLLGRIEAAGARVRVERAARRPQLFASAGLDYSNPNRKIAPPEDKWKQTWDVGVALSWNLFDGGKASAAVARAEARAEAARQQLEDLDRRIRLQVTQRRLELATAQAAVEVAERNREAARENARVASERYKAGVIASSELLDAELSLLRADLDRTETLAQVRLAAAALERALGK